MVHSGEQRCAGRALASLFVFGRREALDIVIRHDTSRPWDRHEPSPSIIQWRSAPFLPFLGQSQRRGEERRVEEREVIHPGIRKGGEGPLRG